jgi:hypothetical protein
MGTFFFMKGGCREYFASHWLTMLEENNLFNLSTQG